MSLNNFFCKKLLLLKFVCANFEICKGEKIMRNFRLMQPEICFVASKTYDRCDFCVSDKILIVS